MEDMFNRALFVGATVVYSQRKGNSAELRSGTVKELWKKEANRWRRETSTVIILSDKGVVVQRSAEDVAVIR